MPTNKIKTIFIGTPDFSIPSLQSLIDDNSFEVVGAITQPDKKVGRKQTITPTPVKVLAQKNNIPVYQPEKIKEFDLARLVPGLDLIVVVAYAQIIPENLLNLPKYGCINVHGSLLPKYRGASCVQAAILSGDKETGVTIMKMDKGLDTGPIIYQEKTEIEPSDTYGSLYSKLSDLGGKILTGTLKKYISGKLNPQPQDDKLASYAGMLKKEDGRIDWTKPAEYIEKFIRSRVPWPGAFTEIQEPGMSSLSFTTKIHKTSPEILKINRYKVGELFMHGTELAVQCGKDALILEALQLFGKKIMSSAELIRGHKDFIGKVLK